jgi:hypothetical protein
MTEADTEKLGWVRPYAWGVATTLILLPLVAWKLVDPRAWKIEDLPFAFIMIAAVGVAFEVSLRVPPRWTYRAGSALGIGTAVLLTLGNLAVGFAGSEDNRINMIFFAAPAMALAGSVAGRFRAWDLAKAMAGAAIAQLAAGLIVFYYGYFTGPLTFAFTGLWLASALSFLRSSRACTAAPDG